MISLPLLVWAGFHQDKWKKETDQIACERQFVDQTGHQIDESVPSSEPNQSETSFFCVSAKHLSVNDTKRTSQTLANTLLRGATVPLILV